MHASLEPRPLPSPQRWMYCITSTRREGSGDYCTVFVGLLHKAALWRCGLMAFGLVALREDKSVAY